MAHAFLSYVRENSVDVDYVAAALRANGVRVWIDRNDIEAGCFWKDAIARAIQSGAYFIAFFSQASLERTQTYMNEELTLALEQLRIRQHDPRWFIPVLIDDVKIPEWPFRPGQSLRDFQAVKLFEAREVGVAHLLNAVGYGDPTTAEEKLLIELLKSRFPLQREHARDQLCYFESLSDEARFIVADTIFNEPVKWLQIEGVKQVLETLGKDNDYAIASQFTSHPNSDIRQLAFEHFFECRTIDAAVLKHALLALCDNSSKIRSKGITLFDGRLHHFPKAIHSVAALLNDGEPLLPERTVEVLLKVPDLWALLPSSDFAAIAKILLLNPNMWRAFGKFAEQNQPVPGAFTELLKEMSNSKDREIQNLALSLIPRGRANYIAKRIRILRGNQAELAELAAHRLGYPENRSVKAIAVLEEAVLSDERPRVRNAAYYALKAQVGLEGLPIQLGTDPSFSEPVWKRSVEIINRRGLDVLEAQELLTLAQQFDANIYISREDQPGYIVNAKEDYFELMMLAASQGTWLIVAAAGREAFEALAGIVTFIDNGMPTRFSRGDRTIQIRP